MCSVSVVHDIYRVRRPSSRRARVAMNIHSYRLTLLDVPADLRADPDGDWTYESLVAAAGLDPEASPPPIVAALFEPWREHPEGAAVVACPGEGRIVIVNCVGATPNALEGLASEAAPEAPQWRRQAARSVGRAA
jgi:hypothetical protein